MVFVLIVHQMVFRVKRYLSKVLRGRIRIEIERIAYEQKEI